MRAVQIAQGAELVEKMEGGYGVPSEKAQNLPGRLLRVAHQNENKPSRSEG